LLLIVLCGGQNQKMGTFNVTITIIVPAEGKKEEEDCRGRWLGEEKKATRGKKAAIRGLHR